MSFTGLARELGDLALEIAHARLAGVAADDLLQGRILELPLARLQAMVLALVGDQVALGDLDLLVLGVAGKADDLHAVEAAPGGCSSCSRWSRT
jgi:hypothetical protein